MASSCRFLQGSINPKATDVYIPVPALAETCLVKQHLQHPHIYLYDHSSLGDCKSYLTVVLTTYLYPSAIKRDTNIAGVDEPKQRQPYPGVKSSDRGRY
jgi:hypothetical protein